MVEIAAKTGCHPSTIRSWACRIGKTPKRPRGSGGRRTADLRSADFGMSDSDISRKFGCDRSTVRAYRRRNGIAPAKRCVSADWSLADPFLSDTEIAARLGCSKSVVGDWRRRMGFGPSPAAGIPFHIRLAAPNRDLSAPTYTPPSWRRSMGPAVRHVPDEVMCWMYDALPHAPSNARAAWGVRKRKTPKIKGIYRCTSCECRLVYHHRPRRCWACRNRAARAGESEVTRNKGKLQRQLRDSVNKKRLPWKCAVDMTNGAEWLAMTRPAVGRWEIGHKIPRIAFNEQNQEHADLCYSPANLFWQCPIENAATKDSMPSGRKARRLAYDDPELVDARRWLKNLNILMGYPPGV